MGRLVLALVLVFRLRCELVLITLIIVVNVGRSDTAGWKAGQLVSGCTFSFCELLPSVLPSATWVSNLHNGSILVVIIRQDN